MLNLNSIMVGTSDAKKLAEYYEKIFGKKADMTEGEWHGWSVGSAFFSIGPHSEVTGKASDPARMMFTLETPDVKKEFNRMKDVEGSTVIKEPYNLDEKGEETSDSEGMAIATLADPDGNYFQLMSPWEQN